MNTIMGYPVMTNDRDNDRRLAYAIWHNDCRMIRLMMCASDKSDSNKIFLRSQTNP